MATSLPPPGPRCAAARCCCAPAGDEANTPPKGNPLASWCSQWSRSGPKEIRTLLDWNRGPSLKTQKCWLPSPGQCIPSVSKHEGSRHAEALCSEGKKTEKPSSSTSRRLAVQPMSAAAAESQLQPLQLLGSDPIPLRFSDFRIRSQTKILEFRTSLVFF